MNEYEWTKDENGEIHHELKVVSENGIGKNAYIDEEKFTADFELMCDSHLKGSRRAFIMEEAYIYIDNFSSEEETTIFIPIKQAWAFIPENFKRISDEYDVDVRVIGWERGMAFKQEIEILRGCEPVEKVTEYDNWAWEAECPSFGG